MEHISGHLWHRYSVNHVSPAALSKKGKQITKERQGNKNGKISDYLDFIKEKGD